MTKTDVTGRALWIFRAVASSFTDEPRESVRRVLVAMAHLSGIDPARILEPIAGDASTAATFEPLAPPAEIVRPPDTMQRVIVADHPYELGAGDVCGLCGLSERRHATVAPHLVSDHVFEISTVAGECARCKLRPECHPIAIVRAPDKPEIADHPFIVGAAMHSPKFCAECGLARELHAEAIV